MTGWKPIEMLNKAHRLKLHAKLNQTKFIQLVNQPPCFLPSHTGLRSYFRSIINIKTFLNQKSESLKSRNVSQM